MTADDAQLVLVEGPEPGTTFPLDEPSLLLGRDPRNAIVIQHPQVSRRHARIVLREGAWVIKDLESTNGTFVNGVLLTEPQTLAPGDTIGLSEAVTLTFQKREPASGDAVPEQPRTKPEPPPAPRSEPPAPRVTSVNARRVAPPPPRQGAPPSAPARTVEERDWTWVWIAAGCAVLLLIAVCATLLILSYLDVIPGIFGYLFREPRWI